MHNLSIELFHIFRTVYLPFQNICDASFFFHQIHSSGTLLCINLSKRNSCLSHEGLQEATFYLLLHQSAELIKTLQSITRLIFARFSIKSNFPP